MYTDSLPPDYFLQNPKTSGICSRFPTIMPVQTFARFLATSLLWSIPSTTMSLISDPANVKPYVFLTSSASIFLLEPAIAQQVRIMCPVVSIASIIVVKQGVRSIIESHFTNFVTRL